MNVQVIEKRGQPEWAVIPYQAYIRLAQDAEMLQDIREYDQAWESIERGEELVPSEVLYSILDGANPVKAWREYRGFTRQQLAKAAGISVTTLTQIESGETEGRPETLSAVAQALHLDLDDIIP